MKILKLMGAILTIAAFIGLCWTLDHRWAYSTLVSQIDNRLEQKIQADKRFDLQRQIFMLEDRYGEVSKMPEDIRENYRFLKRQYDELMKEQVPKEIR
ncbi:MAG: hypothetical protein GY847_01615 [Proteobacteria bacterium]|nr:hypothetical protein [Pseudomonadota bacterium]